MNTVHLLPVLSHPRWDMERAVVAPLWRRALDGMMHILCGLRGHEMVRHWEPAHLCLRCEHCGATTRGWTIDVRPAFRRPAPPRARVV